MNQTYFTEQTFEKMNFQTSPISKGEYDQSLFINCDFSESDLSEIKF